MKKLLFVSVAAIAMMASTLTVFAQQPTVNVGAESFDCIIKNERTYIPMRNVFEELGYQVDWIADEKAVTLFKDDTELTLNTVNSTVTGYGALNNKVVIENSRTYLPLRELLNLLGYEVEWYVDTKTAVVVLPETETATETITETSTEATTEATTEVTTSVVYNYDNVEVNGKPVENKEELVDEILSNIQNGQTQRLTAEDLMSLLPPVPDEETSVYLEE